jgi:hypothetical protein
MRPGARLSAVARRYWDSGACFVPLEAGDDARRLHRRSSRSKLLMQTRSAACERHVRSTLNNRPSRNERAGPKSASKRHRRGIKHCRRFTTE